MVALAGYRFACPVLLPHSVGPFGVCCIRLTQGYLLLLIVASSILCASCPLGGVGVRSARVSIAPFCQLPQCLWPASRAGVGLLTHPWSTLCYTQAAIHCQFVAMLSWAQAGNWVAMYTSRGVGDQNNRSTKPGNFDKDRKVFTLAGVLHAMLGFSLVVGCTM